MRMKHAVMCEPMSKEYGAFLRPLAPSRDLTTDRNRPSPVSRHYLHHDANGRCASDAGNPFINFWISYRTANLGLALII
jgi:hypothetical protein